jgi:hypothetical protein
MSLISAEKPSACVLTVGVTLLPRKCKACLMFKMRTLVQIALQMGFINRVNILVNYGKLHYWLVLLPSTKLGSKIPRTLDLSADNFTYWSKCR